MSNIYGLIVAAPAMAKTFCIEGSSWPLRAVRAQYGMTNPKDESLRTAEISGGFAIATSILEPVMLRALLRMVRNESYVDFPYPPKTYDQEKYCEKMLAKEIPYLYGNYHSKAPWLWQIPQEIVDHLVKITTKKEISKLAKLWRTAFNRAMAERHSLRDTEKLLEDLRIASQEAIRTKKKVILYCST